MTPLGAVPAGMTCPACGVAAPGAARFCPACGERLAGGLEERRVVTVLFADLVDSTRLVESLDPEAARDLLNETFRRLAAEVRRFGGTLERIGLDTGEVAAGPWSGDLRVTGPAVHTAARIQQTAEPDQILLSTRTLRAARDVVEVGPALLFGLRGQRQPAAVVEALGLSPVEPAAEPMVGRESDLPRLIGPLDHAAHHNRLVLLVSDAGVGKSTLVRAATAEIGDRVHVLWGRCLPDWQSLPFWPVREVLAAAAGMAATEPAGVLTASIGRLVADTWPDPVAAPATAEALCRLAGLDPDEPGPAARTDPGQPSLPIPDSLQALVAARLDRLTLSSKRVLCRAAVVGKWFSHAALAAMAQPGDGPLDADLDRLVRAGLIERLPERLAGGQERFAFHHALFRDVAYGMLPKAGRSELHRRLADWLAGAPGEEPSLPEVVAYHLVQAVRLAGEVRAPTGDDRGPAELRLDRGTIRGATGDLPGALAHLKPATGTRRSAVRARAWTELSNVHGMLGRFGESAAAADRAIAEAAAAGDLTGAGELLDQALVQARLAGQAKLVIELRATLLPMLMYLATPLDELRQEALGLVEDARSAGRRSAEATAQVTLGEAAWLQDDLDAAEQHLSEGNRLSLEVGFARKRLWSLLALSQVEIARDRPEAARRLAQEAIELTTLPDGTADVEAELHLAEACLAGADPAGAAAAMTRARAALQEVDVFSRARLRRAEARLASTSGDPAAVALLERSLAELEGTGHRLDQLRSLVDLAPALRRVGRAEDAVAVARRALERATTMGAHALVRRLTQKEEVGR